jgi:NAD(P)-dependent dehydrogenase (short-subunit alcohol dehydrogenase family)
MTHQIRFEKADLMNETDVQNLVNNMPRIDVLIHLVGGFAMGDTARFSLRDWEWQIALNLTTTFLVCKHCIPRMQKHNYGRIITVGSRAALEPVGKMGAYVAAKSAVLAFTQSLADELKETGITANSVVPGTIDTQANRKAMGTSDINKWVKPEAIAELICYLASEQAADISGAAIPIYGGS